MSHEAAGKRDVNMYYGRVNEILPSGKTEDFVIRSIDRSTIFKWACFIIERDFQVEMNMNIEHVCNLRSNFSVFSPYGHLSFKLSFFYCFQNGQN